jgi:hypothetical protein
MNALTRGQNRVICYQIAYEEGIFMKILSKEDDSKREQERERAKIKRVFIRKS